SIASVGGYKLQNGATLTPPYSINGGAISPGDPLGNLPMPTYKNDNCFDGTTMVAGPCTASPNLASGSYSPGVYCGGVTINNGVSVNFAAGTYIIAGGVGLNVASGTVTANGVTFYITDTSGWPCSGINGNSVYPGPVTVNSQAAFTLSAPT